MPHLGFPLPKRLKTARLRAGLSQKTLGIAVGLDEFGASARMNQYERGVHAPEYRLVQQIARALKVPTAYFYADDEQDANLLLGARRLSVSARKSLLEQLQSSD